MSALFELLLSTTLDQLPVLKPVVTLNEDQTLAEAVQLLAKNNILGAPVVNKKGGYVSRMLDMQDILFYTFACAVEEKDKEKKEEKKHPWKYKKEELSGLHQLKLRGKDMGKQCIKHISGVSNKDPLVILKASSTLAEAVHYFTLDAHRAVICDKDDKPIGVISQSNVVSLLSETLQREELQFVGNATPKKDSIKSNKNLVVASKDTPVYEVLELLYLNQISSIALVDKDGVLCGTFSSSDLRGLFVEQWVNLSLPVYDFLKQYHPKSLHCATCTQDSTLLSMCKYMRSAKVHRLWIVDRHFKPVDVVSMTDIMEALKRFSRAPNFPTKPEQQEKKQKSESGPVPTPLLNFLSRVPVLLGDRFIPNTDGVIRPIVSVTRNAKVREAAKLFSDNKILSLPIVEPNAQSFGDAVVGSLDVADLVYHVMKIGMELKVEERSKMTDQEIHELLDSTVGTIDGITRHSGALIPLQMDATLDQAVHYFTLDVYRCPVTDFEGNLIYVLSHLSVIKLLSDYLFRDDFQFVAKLKVSEFIDMNRATITVDCKTSVLDTLFHLYTNEKYAVAVVDENKQLQANFCASNVTGVFLNANSKIFPTLQQPVLEFIKGHCPERLHCITCSTDSTMLEVIQLMTATGAHRLWIVDDQLKLLGVVSTADVMTTLKYHFYSQK